MVAGEKNGEDCDDGDDGDDNGDHKDDGDDDVLMMKHQKHVSLLEHLKHRGRGWEIEPPVNGVGSLTLMPETNHTFFEIFSVFSFESF